MVEVRKFSDTVAARRAADPEFAAEMNRLERKKSVETISRITQYGFQFGAANVSQLVEDKGAVIMSVTTKRQAIEIYVTPSGLIRVSEKRKPYPHELERLESK
jgi:hypothetical protein